MQFVKEFECTLCHSIYPPSNNLMTCPKCGEKGILDINYNYNEMKKVVDKKYFKENKNYSMLRYQPMMSISEFTIPSLEVGWTPLYKSVNLAKSLGLQNLYLKDEGLNPTASLKDRASLVACIKAIENGKNTICCSSTGNAASSLAGNAANLGLKTVIFVPQRAPIGKIAQLVVYGANVIKIEGDYKQTFEASKKVIDKYHFYNRNAAINPHLVEGKKTVALEIAEQLQFQDLDYVFVSVGDGCTIGAVYKGFYDLLNLDLITKIPKIIGVQSDGCSPFYNAFINNTELEETEENTIADSIAVGIPRNPVKGMNAVKKSQGFYMTVSDKEILKSIMLLGKSEGIFAEPAGATGLAGLIKALSDNLIPKSSKIAVIITGNGLKDQNSVLSHITNIYSTESKKLINKINNEDNSNLNMVGLLNLLKN
jgi:threonine synthase